MLGALPLPGFNSLSFNIEFISHPEHSLVKIIYQSKAWVSSTLVRSHGLRLGWTVVAYTQFPDDRLPNFPSRPRLTGTLWIY